MENLLEHRGNDSGLTLRLQTCACPRPGRYCNGLEPDMRKLFEDQKPMFDRKCSVSSPDQGLIGLRVEASLIVEIFDQNSSRRSSECRALEFGEHEAAACSIKRARFVIYFEGLNLMIQATPRISKLEMEEETGHVHSVDVGEGEPSKYSRECHPPSTFWRQGNFVFTSLYASHS